MDETETTELHISLDGIPIPASLAAKAVRRCIAGIGTVDRLLEQGFASEDDLRLLRAGLTGEDEEDAS